MIYLYIMSRRENIKAYYAKKHYEKKTKEKQLEIAIELRNRKYKDIKYLFWENSITRINKAYKKYNVDYELNYNELLGCDENKLLEYINELLAKQEVFTIENYPSWELDHIKPICQFNLNNKQEALECFNYNNIGLLSSLDNKTKKHFS